ncbi:competence protein CoiA [Reichenbachiella agariperforans]|uniref:competence protein CoiA n=1 Tax=Reichenbachiella agariperforans TaxID=156994 RepID=UPI001C08C477|nr:competence protein CoiA family protein [Reichenbachiella agariperforans]MBU2912699.1 competence protein [Reichenbachiella agariperforans]
MKFALIDGSRTEASKGATGSCPVCGSDLIAKCGELKINHWAHKKIRNCDTWWESETEWHRSWKNKFPTDWQEYAFTDDTSGEKHIADIFSEHGWVVEFQHSHIKPEERISRENFYKKMVWVVDGTRLKRDYPRFIKAKDDFRRAGKLGHYFVDFPEEAFPRLWLSGKVPVIFDFQGIESIHDNADLRKYLFCLFPMQSLGTSTLVVISREAFINGIVAGSLFSYPFNITKPSKPRQQIVYKSIPNTGTHHYDPRRKRFVRRERF